MNFNADESCSANRRWEGTGVEIILFLNFEQSGKKIPKILRGSAEILERNPLFSKKFIWAAETKLVTKT